MKLIINADDFGRSADINRAVITAHRQGVLTSASLMVAGAAAAEAVELALATPTLAVGLHLVAVDGPTALDRSRLPRLLNGGERLADAPARLGLRYAFFRAWRRELADEIAAQFRAFAATGLPLSHVDGHQLLHMHPVIMDMLIPLARKYHARGIRVPRDDLSLALRHDPGNRLAKQSTAVTFNLLSQWALPRIGRGGLATTSRSYGLLQSGRMNEAYVGMVLEHLSSSRGRMASAEIYFHPTTGPRTDALGPNPDELRTLLSPGIRRAIERGNLRPSTYADLARDGA